MCWKNTYVYQITAVAQFRCGISKNIVASYIFRELQFYAAIHFIASASILIAEAIYIMRKVRMH